MAQIISGHSPVIKFAGIRSYKALVGAEAVREALGLREVVVGGAMDEAGLGRADGD